MFSPATSHHSRISELNETPEGKLAKELLQGTSKPHPQELATAALLEWALDNLGSDPVWAEAVRQALALAEERDPEALQEAIVPTGFLRTQTRTEAGRRMLQRVVDLVPPDTQPA